MGVRIRTGEEFSLSIIDEFRPHVVILAVGGLPSVPRIKGVDGPNVVKSADLHHTLKKLLRYFSPGVLRWMTKFWMPVGKRVVVIGGKIAACQLAEFLVKRGRKVTIVDEEDTIGEGLVPERKNRLLYWFGKKGVTILTGVTCDEITDRSLTVKTRTGERLTLTADTIIPATPLLPNTAVADAIREKVSEVHLIGDCESPRLIVDAVAGGWRVARDL